ASKGLQNKDFSPVDLVQAFLKRIDQVEHKVMAWVTITGEQALKEAYVAEKMILKGEILGPLHGIPFGAKDIFYTEGVKTTGGSKIIKDFIPNEDAMVIKQLKSNGAILLGKTTTTEF